MTPLPWLALPVPWPWVALWAASLGCALAVRAWRRRRAARIAREADPDVVAELMHAACVAREDAHRWRLRALRLGWRPHERPRDVIDRRWWR